MNRLVVIVCLIFIAIACNKTTDKALKVTVTPDKPFLIPEGSITVNGEEISAPLFGPIQFTLDWTGDNCFKVLIVNLESFGTATNQQPFKGTLSGDDLLQAFASNLQTDGSILINKTATGVTPSKSRDRYFSGVPLPSPLPDTFNIPINVTVQGLQVDCTTRDASGRASGSTVITVQ